MILGFVTVVFLVVAGVHLYLWKRLVRDTLRPGPWRKAGGLLVLSLAMLIPATLILTRTGYVRWLAWPGYIWLALMFYLLVTLAVLEVPRLVVRMVWRANRPTRAEVAHRETTAAASVGVRTKTLDTDGGDRPGDSADDSAGIDRRLLLARGAAIFAGLTAASVTGYGVRTALGGPRLDRVQIPIAKLPRAMDGTRLAVVSDIHLGPLTGPDHMRRIVSMINSTDADVVCVVGDLVDGSVEELGPGAAALRDVRARQGAYFVTGNHEYYSGFQQWVDEVARLGIRPLRNERLEIATRGGVFDLAGVNDLNGTGFGDGPDLARALGDRDTSRPIVLMAHQPIVAHDAAPYGVDLQVSGHTHGGQMVPFNYVVGLAQPVVSGYGRVDGVPVYVTNGAGFWGPPVRVGVPPQVTLVELRTP